MRDEPHELGLSTAFCECGTSCRIPGARLLFREGDGIPPGMTNRRKANDAYPPRATATDRR